MQLGRRLARQLAEAGAGAAFDPQADEIIWPRGRVKRYRAPREERETDKLSLNWYFSPSRWDGAAAEILAQVRRLCPEALPRRFGLFEPLQERYEGPIEFVDFCRAEGWDHVFWKSSPPFFGGSVFGPDRPGRKVGDGPQVGLFTVDLDGAALEDQAWRDTVVALFRSASASAGAFYACATLESGWTATSANTLWMTAAAMSQRVLTPYTEWLGLPPFSPWLSWYGQEYLPLVLDGLISMGEDLSQDPPSLLQRLSGRGRQPELKPTLVRLDAGVLMRLGQLPRHHSELPTIPLKATLTYELPDVGPGQTRPIEAAATEFPKLR